MKIVYISSSTIPSRTANSIHVMKMCQAFARNGHEVTLIAPAGWGEHERGVEDIFGFYGVEPCFTLQRLRVPNVMGRGYFYGLAAAMRARRQAADLVYCRNVAGCYFSLLSGMKAILEIHAPVEEGGRLQESLFRSILRSKRLVKLVAITQALKAHVEERHPTFAGPIQVAPDGADAMGEDVSPFPLASGARLKVGYLGHLFAGRGIELIAEMARRVDRADFHIVGGRDEDVAFWRDKTAAMDNVQVHGFVSPALAERYRASFDILLAPYQTTVTVYGGGGDTARWMSPLKLFEYMAAGKAIICSDLPALREVLTHEANALLCPPSDVDAWSAALERLRDDEALRARLGETARRDFLDNYTWLARAGSLLRERAPAPATTGT